MKTTNDYTIQELLGKKVRSKVDADCIGVISKITPYPEDRYDSYEITWPKRKGQYLNPVSSGCFHGFENTFMEIVEE